MRILKLLLMVLACLGGSQVMAESPWPTKDTSGAMTLAGGGHFKGGHSKGFGHRHFHGPIRHHHGFNGHAHRFHHGFMGHSHRFGMFHKRHGVFFVDDPRFDGHRHFHHFHGIHDRSNGIVIRFHEQRSRMFTDSDFHR